MKCTDFFSAINSAIDAQKIALYSPVMAFTKGVALAKANCTTTVDQAMKADGKNEKNVFALTTKCGDESHVVEIKGAVEKATGNLKGAETQQLKSLTVQDATKLRPSIPYVTLMKLSEASSRNTNCEVKVELDFTTSPTKTSQKVLQSHQSIPSF